MLIYGTTDVSFMERWIARFLNMTQAHNLVLEY